MAKYLVETYYTCSFKVSHYLGDINEENLNNLEKSDDGKFEIIEVKLDNRKTKNLQDTKSGKVEIVSQPINNKDIKSSNKSKPIDENLKRNIAVIPYINSKDTIKYRVKNELYNLNRENTYLTQTPQAFKFKKLYELAINEKNKITDEASLFINKNQKIKFIKGENTNNKITFKSDIKLTKTFFGIGFDIHRLVRNKNLYLGGAKIPFHSGLKGHSDGDVILHSIIDSILGAMRNKDIGSFFPNTKKYKNIRSPKILKPVVESLYKSNFFINNLDINLICEQPKVSKYRDRIINSVSKLMMLKKDLINLKGKTVEKLGLIGKEKAIACEVIISITKYD